MRETIRHAAPPLLLLVAALLPVPVVAVPHGIHVEVSAEDGVHVARGFYAGGTPVANGDVSVIAPGSERAWQTGRTDPAGRFAFLPDAEGTWTVQMDDGRGHRAETRFEVAPAAATHAPAAAPPSPDAETSPATDGPAASDDPLWKLLAGLGLLAGVTGTAYGYTARRKEPDAA